jgi:hypothetical protein
VTSVQTFSIAGGDAGIAQTVQRMSDIIRASVATPIVREAVTQIVGDVSGYDAVPQLYALRDWLSSHFVFLRDPFGVEHLHTPEWQLRTIASAGVVHGDCDDAAILGGALAGAIGCRVVLVTVGFGAPNAPFTHIWASAAPPNSREFLELDVTRPMQEIPVGAISRQKITPVLV